MSVLLTGGAGYIGSHTALCVAQAGLDPVVLPEPRHRTATAMLFCPDARYPGKNTRRLRKAD